MLRAAGVPGAPVVTEDGSYAGGPCTVRAGDGWGSGRAMPAVDVSYPTVPSDQGLDFALDVMVSADVAWVPVVEGGRVVGIVGMNEVISGYQQALRRSLRLIGDVRGGGRAR